MTTKERAYALLIIVAAATLVLLPALNARAKDSFPLSTYPMFAKQRGNPIAYLVVALDQTGQEHRLSPEIFGTSEVLQAKVLIRRALTRGKKSRRQFCQKISRGVARKPGLEHVIELELVKARFDPIEYFTIARKPIKRRVLARCSVTRATP